MKNKDRKRYLIILSVLQIEPYGKVQTSKVIILKIMSALRSLKDEAYSFLMLHSSFFHLFKFVF